jgi:hypothetical protein
MRGLFIGTLCVIALLTKTDLESAHEFSRLGTVESIVDRGTYQLDDSIFIGTLDKVYRNGHYYSHQPPLLATIEAPVYWLLHLPGTRFNNRGRAVMTYAFSLLTNGVAFALTVVVFASILAASGVAVPMRNVLAILLPCGTWLLPYAVVSNSHGVSALLVGVLSYLLLVSDQRGVAPVRAMGIGGVLGLLTAIELLPAVSFLPLTVLYLGMRRDLDRRAWLGFGAALALPLLAHAVINVTITGDLVPAGFHHELFNYPGSVFDDSSLTGTIKYTSFTELGAYAWSALFAGKGFFAFAALIGLSLVVAVLEWRWWARARGAYAVLSGGIVLSVAAALLTTNNYGGAAVGFRHAVYLAPAFLTLLLPWIADERRRTQRTIVIGVAVASSLVMLVYAVRNPWSALTLSSARIGTWEEYVPIIARVVHGNLFNP